MHFLYATTSEGVWHPNICLHISTTFLRTCGEDLPKSAIYDKIMASS